MSFKRIQHIVIAFILMVMSLGAIVGSATAAPALDAHETAVINTGRLNVRLGPSVGYQVAAQVSGGETVTLIGRNTNSSWAKIRTAAGQEGWINTAYILASVSISSLPVIEAPGLTPAAAVNTGALNVRSGPNIAYGSITTVGYGENLSLIARNANSSWVKVRTASGHVGWVNVSLIVSNVAISSLAVEGAEAPPPPAAAPSSGAINMRSGPGLGYSVVAVLTSGTDVSLIGRNSASSWVRISANGQTGWVSANVIQANVTISSLPIVGETTTGATATATIASGAVNVRSGPSVGYHVVTVAPYGAGVTLLARNNNSSWVKIRYNNQEGWVNATLIQTFLNISNLPIGEIPTLTPAATVNTGALNMRQGPGVEYAAITTLSSGTSFTLIGRNNSGSWVKGQLSNGQQGWVNASLIFTNVAVSTLPIVN